MIFIYFYILRDRQTVRQTDRQRILEMEFLYSQRGCRLDRPTKHAPLVKSSTVAARGSRRRIIIMTTMARQGRRGQRRRRHNFNVHNARRIRNPTSTRCRRKMWTRNSIWFQLNGSAAAVAPLSQPASQPPHSAHYPFIRRGFISNTNNQQKRNI